MQLIYLFKNLKNKVYLGLILGLVSTQALASLETWDPKSGLTIPLLEMPSTLGLDSKAKRAIMMGYECCWDQKLIDNVRMQHSLKSIEYSSKVNLKKLQFIVPNKTDLYVWYALNALDVYTTYDGISSNDNIMELNPLLPERPSLAELIIFKTIADYYINPTYMHEQDPELLREFNLVLGLVVINNRHVKNSN